MNKIITFLLLCMASTVMAAFPPPIVRNTYTTNYCTDILINCRAIGIANNNTSIVWNSQWNTIDNSIIAGIISGGINNSIAGPGSDVSVIGGGNLNVIAAGADTSVIAGGGGNNINANDTDCVISGGFLNLIDVGTYNSIAGGTENAVMIGDFSAIGGGAFNVMTLPAASAGYSVIAGGEGNTINTHQSVISGGASNLLLHSANGFSTISGGLFNESSADFTSIIGGFQNTNSGDYSSIIGGYSNRTEGTYSVAGGRSAHALQNGSWALKDSSATPLLNNTANSLVASFSSGYDFQGGGTSVRNLVTTSNAWADASLTVVGKARIGTAGAPAAVLDVNSTVNGTTVFQFKPSQGNYQWTMNDFGTVSSIAGNSANWSVFGIGIAGDSVQRLAFGADSGTPFLSYGPGGASARDTHIKRGTAGGLFITGNVGITTNTPQRMLHINGTGTNYAPMWFSQVNTNPPGVGATVKRHLNIILDDGLQYTIELKQ